MSSNHYDDRLDRAEAIRLPIRKWAQNLKDIGKQFTGAFRPREQVFLETGDRLRELHRKVSTLSEMAELAASRLSSNEFSEMLNGLAGAARQIDALRNSRRGLPEALERVVATTDTMLGSLSALSRVMFHVQVLAVNAKIEASQLNQAGMDFSVFTREIAHLAHGGDQTIGAVKKELLSLRNAAVQAQSLQTTFEKEGVRELDLVAQRLSASIAAMRQQQNRVSQGVREIPARLQSLFSCISDVVSALQIFDMTRQRLEHVEQALTVAADMIGGDTASDMDERQLKVFVNGVSDLQSLQLRHAGDDYHNAVGNVRQNLTTMTQGVPAVGSLCQHSFGQEGDASLSSVSQDIAKAGAIFSQFATVREQAEQSLNQVAAMAASAEKLMRSLNSVNADMRLMGLNASIKCGNIGSQGRALNVIAQELQTYAKLTRNYVESVANDLERVTVMAREHSGVEGADGSEASVCHLKVALESADQSVRATGEVVSRLLSDITNFGQSVVDLTRTASSGFSDRADCHELVEQGLRGLKALASESHPGLSGAALESARREVLAFSESHYTMASERSIHGSAVRGHALVQLLTGEDAPKASIGEASKEPDISGLLF
ncbi:putative Chemotaxis protein [Azospirillaceae bacterium]